jgi:predicted TIM-barrel fold metal-dependent hydrolase
MAHKGGYPVYCPQDLDPKKLSDSIKAVGPTHIVMATDGGLLGSPPPVEMLRMYVLKMQGMGLTDAEIDLMIKENPKKILGLQ